MPNIQEYEAKKADTGLQTNNIGQEALAQEGRRVGLFYKEVGGQVQRLTDEATQAYQQHEAFDLISKGSETLATDYNNRLKASDQMFKDPSFDAADPTVVPKAVQAYSDSLNGQDEHYSHNRQAMEWWLRAKDEHLQSFQQTLIGQLSAHAGVQAIEKVDNTTEQYADSAFNDPTQTVGNIAKLKSLAMGLTANSNVDTKTNDAVNGHILQEQLPKVALAGAMGVIRQSKGDPAALDHFLDQPDVAAVIGDRRAELEDRARQEQEAGVRDQLLNRELANDQAKDTSTATANDYMGALSTALSKGAKFSDPATLQGWNTQVLGDPKLQPDTKDSLIALGQRMAGQSREDINQGNPDLVHSLIQQITSGKAPTDAQIYDRVDVAGGLSMEQAHALVELAHPKTAADQMDTKMLDVAMETWKSQFNSGFGTGVGPGYSDAVNFYLPLIEQRRAAGVPMSEILSNDPKNPNSIYHDRPLASFGQSNQAQVDQQAAAAHPAAQGFDWGSLFNAATSAYRSVVAATSGGSVAIAPITGQRPTAPAATNQAAQQSSGLDQQTYDGIDDVFSSKSDDTQ